MLTYYVIKGSNQFMNILMNPTYWLVAGLVMMVAELIIPGGVVVFFGAGCMVVAAGISLGLVSTWTGAMTLFFIASLLLIISLRGFVMKFAGGDFSKSNTVEILDDIGELVEVIDDIGPGNKIGRILFRGTQWEALGDGDLVLAGEKVRIVALDNVRYIIEKTDKAAS
jgi:membrane protein implicated in regulation of membrane protease activity